MATKAQTKKTNFKDHSQTLKDLLKNPELFNYEKEQLVKLEKQLITAEKKVVKIKEQIEEQKELLETFIVKPVVEKTGNFIKDEIIPMLLELGYEDRIGDKDNINYIYINNSYRHFNSSSALGKILHIGEYAFASGLIKVDGIDFEEINENFEELKPVFKKIEQFAKEHNND